MPQQVDKDSYNEFYKNKVSKLAGVGGKEEYIKVYERTALSPYYKGGKTKGYVRGMSVKNLIEQAKKLNRPFSEITVLDAGCGVGELSVYLACKGFNVIGDDISEQACICGRELAAAIGVTGNCTFIAESLEKISPVPDKSVDFIIGHAALHHFIKYQVAPEFKRVMKPGAEGWFADGYGENKVYRLFQNKKKMAKLGDVRLTKPMIEQYFKDFKLTLTPADWFAMLDKLYQKFLPGKLARKISLLHYKLDRKMPSKARWALLLSGSLMTHIINL